MPLQWAPSHRGLEGNGRAEDIAKEASSLDQSDAAVDVRTVHRAVRPGKSSYGIRFVTAKVGYGKGSYQIKFVLKMFVLDKVHIPKVRKLKLIKGTTQA